MPPHDARALAAAIIRLLTDHPLADMIGRAGHRLVHERFCVERMVAAIETIYDQGWLAWCGRARYHSWRIHGDSRRLTSSCASGGRARAS